MTETTSVHEAIDREIKSQAIVLFMKGSKHMPMCGFSQKVAQILIDSGIEFVTHNVLASDELREGIKEYSNWPTIPQLYISGEFVGGCDIVIEMHENGELKPLLENAITVSE